MMNQAQGDMNKMTQALKLAGVPQDQMRKKAKEKYKSPFSIGQYKLPEEYTAYLNNKNKKANDENVNSDAQTPTHRGKKGR